MTDPTLRATLAAMEKELADVKVPYRLTFDGTYFHAQWHDRENTFPTLNSLRQWVTATVDYWTEATAEPDMWL